MCRKASAISLHFDYMGIAVGSCNQRFELTIPISQYGFEGNNRPNQGVWTRIAGYRVGSVCAVLRRVQDSFLPLVVPAYLARKPSQSRMTRKHTWTSQATAFVMFAAIRPVDLTGGDDGPEGRIVLLPGPPGSDEKLGVETLKVKMGGESGAVCREVPLTGLSDHDQDVLAPAGEQAALANRATEGDGGTDEIEVRKNGGGFFRNGCEDEDPPGTRPTCDLQDVVDATVGHIGADGDATSTAVRSSHIRQRRTDL